MRNRAYINIATDYAQQNAGADRFRVVDGWSCAPVPNPTGFRCTKDGFIFNSVTPQAG